MSEDRRKRKSKQALKKALVNLMHKKRVSEISVRELCDKADLNRSTFYANYININDLLTDLHYDLFDSMSDESGYITNTALINLTSEDRINIVYKMVQYVEHHKDSVTILFINNENNLLEKNMATYFMDKSKVDKKDISKKYPSMYHTIGSFSLLRQWVLDNFPCSAKQLAKIIAFQSDDLAQNYYKNKN